MMNNLENIDNLTENGRVCTTKNGITVETVTIIGQIEGHYLSPENQKATRYEHMIPLIVDIERNPDIDGMLMILNTVGGDVEAGLALAELVAGMSKPTVSLVLGGGHSIGVPLAVSAKCSFIVPSATMTVHPVRMNGTVVGAPQTYTYLHRMQERITEFILRHSRCSRQCFESLVMRTEDMATDVGSIVAGERAVEYGLIDRVGTLAQALEEIERQIREG